MPIIATCEKCGARARGPDSYAGKRARCKCGAVIRFPAAEPAELDSLNTDALAGLGDGQSVGVAVAACPVCQAGLPTGAVLCTACGHNLRTGQQTSFSIENDLPSPSKKKPAKPRDPASDERTATVGRGVWLLVKLGVVVAVIGGGIWMVRSFVTFDPEATGKANMLKLGNGMKVQQVVDICGKPQEVMRGVTEKETGGILPPGGVARVGYMDNFVEAYGKDKLTLGFFFVYRFSAAGEWHVMFDGEGNYRGREEVPNLLRR